MKKNITKPVIFNWDGTNLPLVKSYAVSMKYNLIASVHLQSISHLLQIYFMQGNSSVSIHPLQKLFLTSLTRISNIIHGHILHSDFLESVWWKGMFLCSKRSAPNPMRCIKKLSENAKSWHNDVIKLSDFMERSIFQFPLHKWETYMHSVKKHIMPKYVNAVSLNILQFNEKYFSEGCFMLCLLEKNKKLLFSQYYIPIPS